VYKFELKIILTLLIDLDQFENVCRNTTTTGACVDDKKSDLQNSNGNAYYNICLFGHTFVQNIQSRDFDLTTLVVIRTDYTGSYKSNYHQGLGQLHRKVIN
jgi:hypothetical protein